jgi:hypothetical protein
MLRNRVCLVYAFWSSFQSLEKTIAGTAEMQKLRDLLQASLADCVLKFGTYVDGESDRISGFRRVTLMH